jgi:hypothetical protein
MTQAPVPGYTRRLRSPLLAAPIERRRKVFKQQQTDLQCTVWIADILAATPPNPGRRLPWLVSGSLKGRGGFQRY